VTVLQKRHKRKVARQRKKRRAPQRRNHRAKHTKIKHNSSNNQFDCALLNIEEANMKLHDITQYLSTHPHTKVLALVETWLEPGESLEIPNFEWFGANSARGPLRGQAGVGFLINKSILSSMHYEVKEMPSPKGNNVLWLELTGNKTLHLCVAYSRPNDPLAHETTLKLIEAECLKRKGDIILMGDWNSRSRSNLTGDSNTNPYWKHMDVLLGSANLSLIQTNARQKDDNKHWTNINARGRSVVDFFLQRKTNQTTTSPVDVSRTNRMGSTHSMLTLTIHLKLKQGAKWEPRNTVSYSWDQPSINRYKKKIKSSLDNITRGDLSKNAIDSWAQQLIECIKNCLRPNATRQNKASRKNWRVHKTNKLTNMRMLLYAKADAAKPHLLNVYQHKIKLITREINQQRVSTQSQRQDEIWKKLNRLNPNTQPKEFWRILNSLKNENRSPPSCIVHSEGVSLCKKGAIMEEACRFFEKVTKLEDKPATNFKNLIGRFADHTCEIPNAQRQVLPLRLKEIKKILRALHSGKAPGPDGIPYEALKHGGASLANELAQLIRVMRELHYVPQVLLESSITLIYKKGSPRLMSNYRPITLMNTILKVYEKLLEKDLREQLIDQIHPAQFGSKKGIGTDEALLLLKELKDSSTYHVQHLHMLLCDLSKAYDRVNLDLLWSKLKSMGASEQLILEIRSTYQGQGPSILFGNSKSRKLRLGSG
jgi:hypothetical protein